MKKAKIPQKRIIAVLKILFYINTHNENQRKTIDKSSGYLTFIDYYMLLVAPDKGRTLDRGEIKSGPKNNS